MRLNRVKSWKSKKEVKKIITNQFKNNKAYMRIYNDSVDPRSYQNITKFVNTEN